MATRQKSARPTRKVAVAALSQAIVLILVWAFNTYVSPANPIPEYLNASLIVIVGVVLAYIVPPSEVDDIVTN